MEALTVSNTAPSSRNHRTLVPRIVPDTRAVDPVRLDISGRAAKQSHHDVCAAHSAASIEAESQPARCFRASLERDLLRRWQHSPGDNELVRRANNSRIVIRLSCDQLQCEQRRNCCIDGRACRY